MEPLERLYLGKGDPDIYLDVVPLPQHQIDGIRFLYKQWKKKKLGVVLNDPSGYGKTLQVVLFLKAIRSLMKEPVLILCNEEQMDSWMRHFCEWTDFGDEVIIETINPNNTKMTICVNPSKNVGWFARRSWGVVVVDDIHNVKEVIDHDFKAKLRIWITAENVKKNLTSFSRIFRWLKPNEGLCLEDFTSTAMKVPDDLTKMILMDAFLRDFVLRRDNFKTPFKQAENISTSTAMQPKMSRKNKDATGTKIKRSKKNVAVEPNVSKSEVTEVNNEDFVMDVESFINDKKPIAFDEIFERNVDDTNCTTVVKTEISSDCGIVCEFDDESVKAGASSVGNNDGKEIKPFESMNIGKDINISDVEKSDYTLNVEIKKSEGLKGSVDDKVTEKDSKKFDEIMQEAEEKSMKKFKGSLLDSIFNGLK